MPKNELIGELESYQNTFHSETETKQDEEKVYELGGRAAATKKPYSSPRLVIYGAVIRYHQPTRC